MGFLHLLPEVDIKLKKANEAFEDYYKNKEKSHFPFSYLLAVLGYSFILFIEKIIFENHEHLKTEPKEEEVKELFEVKPDDSRAYSLNMEIKPETNHINRPDKSLGQNTKLLTYTDKKGILKLENSFVVPVENNPSRKLTMIKTNSNQTTKFNLENIIEKKERKFKRLFSTVNRMSDLAGSKCNLLINLVVGNKARSPNTEQLISENKSGIKSQNDEKIQNPPIGSYLLILALSIHAVFEGIALGLQDTKSSILEMLIAILFHKWVEVISIVIIN